MIQLKAPGLRKFQKLLVEAASVKNPDGVLKCCREKWLRFRVASLRSNHRREHYQTVAPWPSAGIGRTERWLRTKAISLRSDQTAISHKRTTLPEYTVDLFISVPDTRSNKTVSLQPPSQPTPSHPARIATDYCSPFLLLLLQLLILAGGNFLV